MIKTVYTLIVEGYSPRILSLTYPFLAEYAAKINADLMPITERLHPGYTPAFEKLQIYDLSRKRGDDWSIYLDADVLVHRDLFDVAEQLPMDTVLQNGFDFSPNRFAPCDFFRRDGRNIGCCNWFTMASKLCRDIWAPPDISYEECVANIYPINKELLGGVNAEHLVDDYILSRNLARFGLKYKSFKEFLANIRPPGGDFFRHYYGGTEQAKLELLYRSRNDFLMDDLNIKKAVQIPGWMQPGELLWLADQAKVSKKIVEIGSYCGRSTRAFADNTDGRVLAVDTWKGTSEQPAAEEKYAPKGLKAAFSDNLADHIRSGKVTLLDRDSVSAAKICKDKGEKFDLIFIDAAHDYESVLADIRAWSPLLTEHGLLCGHDYGPLADKPFSLVDWGVDQAVEELVKHPQVGPTSIWFREPACVPEPLIV